MRKNAKNMLVKKSTVAVAVFLILSTVFVTCLCVATADTVPTQPLAYISAAPNPVGVGQTVAIETGFTPSLAVGLNYTNFVVKITDPDGKLTSLGPRTSNMDGSQYWPFSPDKAGNWTLQLVYPGETLQSGQVLLPASSAIINLFVQQKPIQALPPAELPTDLWTRPINAQNREWYSISGDWAMMGYNASSNFYNPYTTAPNSAHINWVKQTAVSGLAGGAYGMNGRYGDNAQVEVTIGGLAYYITAGGNAGQETGGVTHCVNIRTGQELWTQTGIDSSLSTLLVTKAENIGGTNIKAFGTVAYSAYLMNIGNGGLKKWNAYTGALVCNVSGMAGTYVDPYVYSVQTLGTKNYLIKWNTDGSSSNFTSRIIYNVTYPLNGVAGISGNIGFYSDVAVGGTGALMPIAPWGAFNTDTGSIIWMRNVTELERRYVGGPAMLAYGKYFYPLYHSDAFPSGMRGYAAIDLQTGQQSYLSDTGAYPWGNYLGYFQAASYGYFYTLSYDGHVYAYNATTGKIAWSFYSGSSGLETVIGSYPFFSDLSVADGKVYVVNCEHGPMPPLNRGYKLFCIDAYTGQGLWNVSFFGYFAYVGGCPIISDGYAMATNWYDNQIYCFGKGQSATTVTAPQTAIPQGSTVMIQGTVTDQSPGQTCLGIPAAGTPAISDESMSQWMEYLYQQQPEPINARGVLVTLSVFDPNNNTYTIGRTTSDTHGNYAIDWAPPVPGLYHVTATFEGSDSYYSSSGATYFLVSNAPSAAVTPTPTATQPPETTARLTPTQLPVSPEPTQAPQPATADVTTTYVAVAAAVIIVAVIAAAIVLRSRK